MNEEASMKRGCHLYGREIAVLTFFDIVLTLANCIFFKAGAIFAPKTYRFTLSLYDKVCSYDYEWTSQSLTN